ncbi:MAG: hypothetical protein ACI4O0_01140 [Candidatus Limivicinus sp.]
MDYPLLLGGKEAGRLRVERQGLYTCMEVSAEEREGLLRIWVQGPDQEAYLGVLQPGEGGMYLRRRLSRRELAAFPAVIEQASDQRLPTKKVNITTEAPESLPPPEPPEPEGEAEAQTEPENMPEAQTEPSTLLWRARRDGSLVAEEGGQRLLALPASLRRAPQGADLRRIGGREYLVFRY